MKRLLPFALGLLFAFGCNTNPFDLGERNPSARLSSRPAPINSAWESRRGGTYSSGANQALRATSSSDLVGTKSGTTMTQRASSFSPSDNPWRAIPLYAIERGLNRPESALPYLGQVLISNMAFDSRNGGSSWDDDANGYITLASPTGPVTSDRWLKGDDEVPLHSPKGLATLGDDLWIADNTRLLRSRLNGFMASPPEAYILDELKPERLDDIVSDGTSIYVSDAGLDLVYQIDLSTGIYSPTYRRLLGPPAINGLAARDGRVYATSMEDGDIYAIDPNGAPPTPFGFEGAFRACNGIDILPDGSFVVSDLRGGGVFVVGADKSVTPIIKFDAPGDIAFDPETSQLYVPQIHEHRINVYRLTQK